MAHTIRPNSNVRNVYEIKVSGNLPSDLRGIYHRQGSSPSAAKMNLARYFRTGLGGRKRKASQSTKVLIEYMSAKKVL